MRFKIKIVLALLLILRYAPHVISFYCHEIIKDDVDFWSKCYGIKCPRLLGHLYFLTYYKEYRNVMYKRIAFSLFHKILAPPCQAYILQLHERK